MPQEGHKDKESIKTFPGSNGLQSLDVSSETVQYSDVAALSTFLFCVLTQKPLEPTGKVFHSCTLNPPLLSVCKNRCIKGIREVWVEPLKSDNEYTDMVVEVLFSFPTHFENVMACLICFQKKIYLPHYFKLIGDPWADLVLRFVKDCRNRLNYGKFYFLKSLFAEKRTSGKCAKDMFNSNLKHFLLLYLSTPRRPTGYWVTVLLVFYFIVTI